MHKLTIAIIYVGIFYCQNTFGESNTLYQTFNKSKLTNKIKLYKKNGKKIYIKTKKIKKYFLKFKSTKLKLARVVSQRYNLKLIIKKNNQFILGPCLKQSNCQKAILFLKTKKIKTNKFLKQVTKYYLQEKNNQTISFGKKIAPSITAKRIRKTNKQFSFSKKELQISQSKFTDSTLAKYQTSSQAKLWTQTTLGNNYALNVGINYYNQIQTGSTNDLVNNFDYLNTFLKYSSNKLTVTAGFQNITWGKLDEISPNDKISRENLSSYFTYDKKDRLLGNLLLKVDSYWRGNKLQIIYGPNQKEHLLPNSQSIWSPINQSSGNLQGVPSSDIIKEILTYGKVITTKEIGDLWGIRFDYTHSKIDIGINYATLISLSPSLYINQNFVNAISTGTPISTAILTYSDQLIKKAYERISFVGIDSSFSFGSSVFKQEFALTLDKTIILDNLVISKENLLDYGISWEYQFNKIPINFYLQINGNYWMTKENILGLTSQATVSAQLEYLISNEEIKINLRSIFSISTQDSLNKLQLSYLGFENLELYTNFLYFAEKEGTNLRFYKENKLISLALVGSF